MKKAKPFWLSSSEDIFLRELTSNLCNKSLKEVVA